ncbi:haloalkane dehalogenase [Natrinema thermotolerans]|uniref:Haloalkane dehalogenase n=1 Tax=Natrinema thermotolerans TaxID=121872 RepID=A0AAF0P8E0_9EURY|nr:haloalkane dehalogenase [Natrinema thermotolerans]QCC60292.1 alpha/beta fold hydrolase [Natrinema thermotolerans]QCC61201.1 alpha/beta fold hydrolase [Natrinema thermotolerans]WMT07313.1 haloalkane dehalogenase [Natrinema thermotolerans]
MVVSVSEEHFEDVPDFDYEPQYVDVGELDMAYVETGGSEGNGDAEETFLCLHGEPTWSFLYRKMMPTLAERGRVVVPDLIGCGRSDRYEDRDDYTVEMHYDALRTFVEELDLTDITLVCQDWGGLLGLSLAAEQPERFARLVPMNTGLPDGTQEMTDTWHAFAEMVATAEDLDIGELVANGCYRNLSEDVIDAYRAPFSDERYMAGARTFPGLVPQSPDDPGADLFADARDRLAEWEKPAFVLFASEDPITADNRDPLRRLLPTASDQPDVWIDEAAHFLQEDAGEEIADRIVEFVDRT